MSTILSGIVVALCGKTFSRDSCAAERLKDLIESNGGKLCPTVTSAVHYVVAADGDTLKYKDSRAVSAREQGAKLVYHSFFRECVRRKCVIDLDRVGVEHGFLVIVTNPEREDGIRFTPGGHLFARFDNSKSNYHHNMLKQTGADAGSVIKSSSRKTGISLEIPPLSSFTLRHAIRELVQNQGDAILQSILEIPKERKFRTEYAGPTNVRILLNGACVGFWGLSRAGPKFELHLINLGRAIPFNAILTGFSDKTGADRRIAAGGYGVGLGDAIKYLLVKENAEECTYYAFSPNADSGSHYRRMKFHRGKDNSADEIKRTVTDMAGTTAWPPAIQKLQQSLVTGKLSTSTACTALYVSWIKDEQGLATLRHRLLEAIQDNILLHNPAHIVKRAALKLLVKPDTQTSQDREPKLEEQPGWVLVHPIGRKQVRLFQEPGLQTSQSPAAPDAALGSRIELVLAAPCFKGVMNRDRDLGWDWPRVQDLIVSAVLDAAKTEWAEMTAAERRTACDAQSAESLLDALRPVNRALMEDMIGIVEFLKANPETTLRNTHIFPIGQAINSQAREGRSLRPAIREHFAMILGGFDVVTSPDDLAKLDAVRDAVRRNRLPEDLLPRRPLLMPKQLSDMFNTRVEALSTGVLSSIARDSAFTWTPRDRHVWDKVVQGARKEDGEPISIPRMCIADLDPILLGRQTWATVPCDVSPESAGTALITSLRLDDSRCCISALHAVTERNQLLRKCMMRLLCLALAGPGSVDGGGVGEVNASSDTDCIVLDDSDEMADEENCTHGDRESASAGGRDQSQLYQAGSKVVGGLPDWPGVNGGGSLQKGCAPRPHAQAITCSAAAEHQDSDREATDCASAPLHASRPSAPDGAQNAGSTQRQAAAAPGGRSAAPSPSPAENARRAEGGVDGAGASKRLAFSSPCSTAFPPSSSSGPGVVSSAGPGGPAAASPLFGAAVGGSASSPEPAPAVGSRSLPEPARPAVREAASSKAAGAAMMSSPVEPAGADPSHGGGSGASLLPQPRENGAGIKRRRSSEGAGDAGKELGSRDAGGSLPSPQSVAAGLAASAPLSAKEEKGEAGGGCTSDPATTGGEAEEGKSRVVKVWVLVQEDHDAARGRCSQVMGVFSTRMLAAQAWASDQTPQSLADRSPAAARHKRPRLSASGEDCTMYIEPHVLV